MNIINQNQAVDYFKQGRTIIFPTETSYGLGCDATNQNAVDKIFKIKGRGDEKPLLVVVANVEMAKEYLEWTPLLEKLANQYWPGALTIVGLAKSNKSKKNASKREAINRDAINRVCTVLAKGVISKFGTLAVRVTSAKIPKFLSENLGHPVVATSANVSGAGDIYYSNDIIKMFAEREFQPDGFLDSGILPKNPPTTIVSVVDGKINVLRQGEVKINNE